MADIREIVTRKVGPLQVWAWTLIVAAGVGAMMVMKRNKAATAKPGSGTGPGGTAGDFQSSTSSTTTDASGNTTTTQYNATGQSPFGIPGYLTQQGYPMPYSLGDIYNNISTTVPVDVHYPEHHVPPPPPPPPQQTIPPAPPPPPPPPPPNRVGVWTVRPGDSLWLIASETLKWKGDPNPSPQSITGYWHQIYDRNRGVIGGNPNLIHPGQKFDLP